MQKLIRFALTAIGSCSLLLAAPAQAQTFPNCDFETWATRNNTLVPTNWQTTDDVFAAVFGSPLPFSTGTVTRTTDRQNGTYAVKLENRANPLFMATIPGILVLGNRISQQQSVPGGLPFTARPANLEFYYKLTGANAANDSAQIVVTLTRTVNGNKQPVAGAERLLRTPASTYTLVTMPLSYSSGIMPDSVHILMTSSSADVPTAGTALFIDNMRFTGTATATRNPKLEEAVSVFPNPSTTGTFTLTSTEPALLAASYKVADAAGRVVLRGEAARPASFRTIDLGKQPAGLYTLQLQTAEGVLTRKLAVQ
ncbi:hypothetical protein GCM10023185_02160 [Hymenobacter saemangeumensis]|uniref:Secretion system C-terminal sorting domain-containing protein n=1 Tax=Hymenobacter saemangeumensis TaxID=1084522 RepID=A0ABP8HY19_9BACT